MKQRIRQALAQRESQAIITIGLTPAAVLLPIFEREGEYYVLFTKRTQKVEHHKGQISFPGGAYDANDGDLIATALRESFEEIGICAADIELLGNLDNQVTTSSNFVISPFVGIISYPCQFKINRNEVEELVEVPLSALLDQDRWQMEHLEHHGERQPQYRYHYRDQVIWGVTAGIMRQFLDVVFG